MIRTLIMLMSIMCIGATCTSQPEMNETPCQPGKTICGGQGLQTVKLCNPDGEWTTVVHCDMSQADLTCQLGHDGLHSCYPRQK